MNETYRCLVEKEFEVENKWKSLKIRDSYKLRLREMFVANWQEGGHNCLVLEGFVRKHYILGQTPNWRYCVLNKFSPNTWKNEVGTRHLYVLRRWCNITKKFNNARLQKKNLKTHFPYFSNLTIIFSKSKSQ